MNQIRAIQALNKREIENGVPPEASWHTDYRDTAFVYFGGLPYELSEGDVITIFSQFGEPVFLKLARDRETGKSKGFGWLKYEDQRSTDLAVDNLGGSEIGGRLIRVDHARYKQRDDEDPEEGKIGWEDMVRRERAEKGLPEEEEESEEEDEGPSRPLLKEERELQLLIENHDDEDPMKQFLIDEKKQEVEEALRRERKKEEKQSRKHKERHHRSHRSRREGSDDEGRDRRRDRDRGQDRDRDRERERDRERDRAPVGPSERDRTPTGPFRDPTPLGWREKEAEGSHRERRHRRPREDGREEARYSSREERDREPRRARDDSADSKRHQRRERDEDGHRRDRRRSRSRSPR